MAYPYTINTRATGTVVTAAIWTADHQQHVDNQIPSSTDDQSANLAAMQTARDPYPAGAPSLAVTLAEELQSIRYKLAQAWVPSAYKSGLTLSNNAGDATNDIDIAAGEAVDGTNTARTYWYQNFELLKLAAGITKQLDAAWAVGTNAGMRASGAAIANATYHIFVIKRPDTGVVDIAADTSATGANIAANTNVAYTLMRRIGSIMREGGVIVPFAQAGVRFDRKVPINSYDGTNPGTNAVTVTATLPTGLSVEAIMGLGINTGAGGGVSMLVTALDTTDTVPSATLNNARLTSSAAGGGQYHVRTNTSAQFRFRSDFSDGSVIIRFTTVGWNDFQLNLGT